MNTYYISLGDNRKVTAKAYLNALRIAQANPTATFSESFTSSWLSATGAEIVRQHWDMVHRKWASQYPVPGKGNRAAKRVQALRDSHASCKWCGRHIETERQQFCDSQCRRDYNG